MGPAHVENVADLACRTALTARGVAHISFPVDLQDQKAMRQASARNVPQHTSDVFACGALLPEPRDVAQAAEILNDGKKIVILAGRGALGASRELEQLADVLAAPIIKPLLGKACVPDDSPFTTGGIGLLGTSASQEAIETCETLVLVGTSFPYIEFLPKPKQAQAIQIDIDPRRIGLRYPVDVGLVGDCRSALRLLLPLLRRSENRSFLEKSQKNMEDWRKLMHERATRSDVPMKPQVVVSEFGKRLRDDAIVSCDTGTVTTWWARHIGAKRDQMHSVSGMLASMGCGLPYAIAAQIAYPERQCVALAGDGGFSMLMVEFSTAVKYSLPIKVLVLKNNTLGMIKWEQMVFLGNPEYGCDLHPIDFAAFARACGGSGFTIENPKDCGRILDEAFETTGPVIIDAIVDPFEPPMPPKVTVAQATKLAKSLLRGEPNRMKIAYTLMENRVRELI